MPGASSANPDTQCQARDMPWQTAVPKMWPAFLECTTTSARGSIRHPLLLTALPTLLDNSDSNPTPRATLGSAHRDGHEYCTSPACVMPWSPFPALDASSLSPRYPPEGGFELKLCSAPDQAMLVMPKPSPAQPWRRQGEPQEMQGAEEGLERGRDVAQTHHKPG